MFFYAISFFSFFLILFSLFRRSGQALLEPFFYFYVLFVFYVVIPSGLYLSMPPSIVGVSNYALTFHFYYSSYCWLLFTLLFFFLCVNKIGFTSNINILNFDTKQLVYLVIFISGFYFVFFFKDSPGIGVLWSSRRLAADFWRDFNSVYKLMFYFYFVTSVVLYLVLKERRVKYLFLLAPFVMFDLATTSRTYLLFCLMIVVFCFLAQNRKVNIPMLCLIGISIVAMEVIRAYYQWGTAFFGSGLVAFMPKEFMYTTLSSYIILDSAEKVDLGYFILHVLSRSVAPGIFQSFYGDALYWFRQIIDANSNVSFGLGGSLFSEIYAIDSEVLYIFYPVMVSSFFILLSSVRGKLGFFGLLLTVFVILQIYPMMRTGFFYNIFSIPYYFIYTFCWYWILRLIFKKSFYLETEVRF